MCLQHNANKLYQWTQNWELALNIDICMVCKCRYGRNIIISSNYLLTIISIKLEEVYTVRDLGATFDGNLTFSDRCLDKIEKTTAIKRTKSTR